LCKTLLPEINLQDRENDESSNTISKEYWKQFDLCRNLDEPYLEAEEKYLDEPHNLKARTEFMRLSKQVMIQQDRLDFWREQMRGESNNPVQLPVTQPFEEPDKGHGNGTVVVVGSKPIDIPAAKGKKLPRIEELNLRDSNGEAVVEPPEAKGLRPAKGKAKLNVQSRLAEPKSEQDNGKLLFPGPKLIDLRSAHGTKPVLQEPQPTDPVTASGDKPVCEASKPLDIRPAKGKKKVRFALPEDEGRQVRFKVPGAEQRICP
jgi:hypothetical protein